MSNNKIFNVFIIIALSLFFFSCEENEVFPSNYYDCNFDFENTGATHPKASTYQDILDTHRKNGIVGAVLLVKDSDGLWVGADGKQILPLEQIWKHVILF